jgi:hypothetical protein
MKYKIICLFLFFSGFLNAQSVVLLQQDSVIYIEENVDISDYYKEFRLDLYYNNNTQDTISIHWRRELSGNCPAAWEIITADDNITYTPFVNQSIYSITMLPADSNFFLINFFYPRSVAGCCDVKMIFSRANPPTFDIDTAYYRIGINSNGCMTTSTIVQNFEEIHLSPNPTHGIVNISNSHLIEAVEVLDMAGRIRQQWDFPILKEMDISFLEKGIYIFRIKNRSGDFWIRKVLKL